MEKDFQRIVNFNVSVREIRGKVGVHAQTRREEGLPTASAYMWRNSRECLPQLSVGPNQVLANLEKSADSPSAPKAEVEKSGKHRDGYQLSFFQLDDPLLSQIRDRLLTLDIDNLTPLAALSHAARPEEADKGN